MRPVPGTPGERLYSLAVGLLRPLLPIAGLGSPKAARAVAGRRSSLSRLAGWARRGRRPERPLIWLHGASAGELFGAAPVIERLRSRRTLQLFASYSSPSAEAALPVLRPDHADFLPPDTTRETGRALELLRPSAVVCAKTDLWPGLSRSAAARGVPLGMVNATVSTGSSRLRWPARRLLAGAYSRLSAVGAVTEADAARLRRLGVAPDALRITGDAAFDEALTRAASAGEGHPRLIAWAARSAPRDPSGRGGAAGLLLVAGSTWAEDEALLLEAVAALRATDVRIALVLVPHEPSTARVAELLGRCRDRLGEEPSLWSELAGEATEIPAPAIAGASPATDGALVVDTVGVLSALYPAADVAYVGGAMGRGLHSVVEPAAAGIPVLVGRGATRWEAEGLREAGAALRVGAREIGPALRRLASDPAWRGRMARAARRYVEAGAGAAERGAALIEELMDRGSERG